MKYIVIIFMLFSIGIYGQGIEPLQLQESPYHGGILRAQDRVWSEWMQDSVNYYIHDTMPAFSIIEDLIFSNDTLTLQTNNGNFQVNISTGTKIDSLIYSGDTLRLYTDAGIFKTKIEAGSSGGVKGTGASNKVAYWASSDSLSFNTNFHYVNSLNQLGLGTASPNTYLYDGRTGLAIYGTSHARLAIANSTTNWLHYTESANYRIYNSSFGEVFKISSDNGKWQGGAYSSTGTNKAAYFNTSGELQRGDNDVLDGIGIAGYVARWHDGNTVTTGGLYFPGEASMQMGLGTTTPNTYLQSGTSKGLAIHDASGDPRLSISNSARSWLYYMQGNSLNIWNNSSGDLIQFTDAGRMGVNVTSPSRTLDVSGEVRIRDLVTTNPTYLTGADDNGVISRTTLGTGLSLSGTTLSATSLGTVTSVGLTAGTSGTDINVSGSPITTSGTITLNIPTASASIRGALSSTDWTTFNNKVGGSGAANKVAFWNGTSTLSSNTNFHWDNTNSRLGIGTSSPSEPLHIGSGNMRVGTTVGTLNKTYYGDGNFVYVGEDVVDDRLGLRGASVSININGSTGSSGQALVSNGTTLSYQNVGSGTVTSVGLSAGNGITVGGTNPVTSSGTISVTNSKPFDYIGLQANSGTAQAITNTGNINFTGSGGTTVTRSGNTISINSTTSSLPSGSNGNTLRHDGSAWIANSFLYNNGSKIGINSTSPLTDLQVHIPNVAYSSGRGILNTHQNSSYGFMANFAGNSTYQLTFGLQSSAFNFLGNSGIYFSGDTDRIGIKTSAPSFDLHVNGTFGVTNRGGTPTVLAGWSSANQAVNVSTGNSVQLSSGILDAAAINFGTIYYTGQTYASMGSTPVKLVYALDTYSSGGITANSVETANLVLGANQAGVYEITYSFCYYASSAVTIQSSVYRNDQILTGTGSIKKLPGSGSGNEECMCKTSILSLSNNDQLDLRVWSAGGSVTFQLLSEGSLIVKKLRVN